MNIFLCVEIGMERVVRMGRKRVREWVKIGGSGKMQEKVGLGKGLVGRGVAGEGEKKGVGGGKMGRKMGREGGEVVEG